MAFFVGAVHGRLNWCFQLLAIIKKNYSVGDKPQ
jgi:hypothetical protein